MYKYTQFKLIIINLKIYIQFVNAKHFKAAE